MGFDGEGVPGPRGWDAGGGQTVGYDCFATKARFKVLRWKNRKIILVGNNGQKRNMRINRAIATMRVAFCVFVSVGSLIIPQWLESM